MKYRRKKTAYKAQGSDAEEPVSERALTNKPERALFVETGRRVSEARMKLGLAQSDLCAQAGIGVRTLVRYEGGWRNPGPGVLAALARLGVNTNWVLDGTGEMMVWAIEGDIDLMRQAKAHKTLKAAIQAVGYEPNEDGFEALMKTLMDTRAEATQEFVEYVLRKLKAGSQKT